MNIIKSKLALLLNIDEDNLSYDKFADKWNISLPSYIAADIDYNYVKIPKKLVKDGELIVKFGSMSGDSVKFDFSNLGLNTLKGVPERVTGDFDCSNNNFDCLDYCPESISLGNFICNNNKLKIINKLPILHAFIFTSYYNFNNCEIEEICLDKSYENIITFNGSKILKINDDNKQDLNLYKTSNNYFKKFNYTQFN